MKWDRYGAPSEVAELTRLLRARSARLYVCLLAIILLILLSIGIIDKWPKEPQQSLADGFGHALWEVARNSYMNFLATLFGMLISVVVARFLFGDNPSEHSAVDAGIARVTENTPPLTLVREITDRISKLGADEVIISDNWLCALHEDMYPALKSAVVTAVERGARITFVLMHPNSPLAHRRELVVARVRHNVSKNVRSSLQSLRGIYQECIKRGSFDKNQGSMTAYCVDSYLSLSTYVLPQVAYVGFFGPKDTSIISPQMLVEVPSMIGSLAVEYAREAKKVAANPQAVDSYDEKFLRYGVQINLAARIQGQEPNGETEFSQQALDRLLEENEKLQQSGAIPLEEVMEHILDSQAIDLFHVLSRDNAVDRLRKFLDQYPDTYSRRKSKPELATIIEKLAEAIR